MEKAKTNHKYKDSVFTLLFGEKKNLLELYNAIENTNYGNDTDIKITTLKNALYKKRINDISFILDGYGIFVYLVKEYAKKMPRDAAISRAIGDCIRRG